MIRMGCALLAATLFSAVPAGAAVVDFNGYQSQANATMPGHWLYAQGFHFVLDPNSSFESVDYCGGNCGMVSNGTPALFLGNFGSITMGAMGNAAFSLASLDIAGSWLDSSRWASTVTAIGTRADGSTVSQSIALATIGASFTTWTLAGFDDLSAVRFVGAVNANGGANNAEFQLDNLVTTGATGVRAFAVSEVPEPASWATAMLGLGLVGASLRGRRREARARVFA